MFGVYFFNNAANNFETSGVHCVLCGGDETLTVLARFSVLVADEPAIKDVWLCKGPAGFKMFVCCMNVTLRKYFTPGGYEVCSSCFDTSLFRLHTDQTVRVCLQRLADKFAQRSARAITQEAYDEYSKHYGFNHSPNNFAMKPYVNVISSTMFDIQHTFFENGLLDVEFGEVMGELHDNKSPTTYTVVRDYLKLSLIHI